MEVKVDKQIILNAIFEQKKFKLTIENSIGGVVNLKSGEYFDGDILIAEALPNENYHFWGFDGYSK